MKPEISIIILSYNTKRLTLQTLETLFAHTCGISLEVIVVDNASTDGSVKAIAEQFPQVKILPQTSNLGFGKANNVGAQHAKGEYLGFYNSDLILNDTSIRPLIDYLRSHPTAGIVAPKIFLENGRTIQPGSFGPEPTLLSLLSRGQQKHDTQSPRANEPTTIDWVTGAAFCIRADLYRRLGGFDENIFMYYEDVDLSRRVRKAGYSVVWLPEATLIHLGGRSSTNKWNRKKRYYAAQSYYMRKHHGVIGAILLQLLRLPIVLKNRFFA